MVILAVLLRMFLADASVFDCAESLTIPTLQSGVMPYDWVEDEGGAGKVAVRFVIGADGRAKDIRIQTKSYEFGITRWIKRSLESSRFKTSCGGRPIQMDYTLVVHRRSSGYSLPAASIGPGNRIKLEFNEEKGSAPLLTNRPQAK